MDDQTDNQGKPYRPPHTLFGSGQKNANRKGRPKVETKAIDEMAERRVTLGLRNGKPIRKTLAEVERETLMADALDGDAKSVRRALEWYHKEQMEELRRPKRKKTLKLADGISQFAQLAATVLFGPKKKLQDELVARGMARVVHGHTILEPEVRTLLMDRRWKS